MKNVVESVVIQPYFRLEVQHRVALQVEDNFLVVERVEETASARHHEAEMARSGVGHDGEGAVQPVAGHADHPHGNASLCHPSIQDHALLRAGKSRGRQKQQKKY